VSWGCGGEGLKMDWGWIIEGAKGEDKGARRELERVQYIGHPSKELMPYLN
jgi:hypothetical protein